MTGPAFIRRTTTHASKKRTNARVGQVENSKKIFLNRFLQSFHLNAADTTKIVVKANWVIDPIGKNKTMICAKVVSNINPLTR